MLTDEQAKQLMVRIQARLDPAVLEAVTREAVRLGPEALRLLLHFPQPLLYAAQRHWIVRVALAMPREQTLPILADALTNPAWQIHQMAGDALVRIGDSARPAVLEVLRTCRAPCGRVQAIRLLHRMNMPHLADGSVDSGTLQAIADAAAGDGDPEVKVTALKVLSRSGAARHAGAVLAALSDDDAAVRVEAAIAAGRMNLTGAADALAQMLGDVSGTDRADVVHAIGRIGASSAAPAVRDALTDEDPYVRWSAAVALRRLRDPDNAQALQHAAGDAEPYVAAAARETLASASV